MGHLNAVKTAGLLGLLCIGLFIFLRSENTATTTPAGQTTERFARSLEGTEPDGSLRFFANLPASATVNVADLPNEALKRMFDYYLSALGEADEASVLQQIGLEIDKNLSGAHARAARQLLGKYVGYKKALADLEQGLGRDGQTSEGGIDSIRKRFEGMRQLREKFFDPREHSEMFGFEEAYDRVALSQLEITQNGQLSDAQKAARLSALQANMPAAVKADLDAPRQVARLQDKVAQLREQGASDDEIYRLRAQTFTPEAAARLADVDREEAAWQNRVGQYQAARQQILTSIDSPSQQQEALLQLQLKQFSPQERPRLKAYEGV
jgi:lipase chaperone LimK